jgi:thiosulfate/3-mercaptopyruvate sulfurtransferase
MTTDLEGSARRRVLVEPEELAARLERGERVVLLDVRGSMTGPPGRPEHEAGHLPGAVFVDLETELSSPDGPGGGRHRLPDPGAFQVVMRAAGVDDDVPVVAYDGATSLYAARLWWLLTDAGHADVRVLDGGYAAWVDAGLPVETGPVAPPAPGGFVARPGHRERVWADDILAGLDVPVVDVRAANRYRGETEPFDPVAGHIPGALNRPATELLDERSRFRPAADVAAAFAGVEAPVLYCGSGVTAAQALLALESAGLQGARIYPGSWSDWLSDPTRDVATGAEGDETVTRRA